MEERIIYALVWMTLGLVSITDIKHKRINLLVLLVACIFCMALRIYGHLDLKSSAYGILVGMISLFIARITRQSIGYGDTAMIGFLGICIGAVKCIELILIAVLMISVAGLVMIVLGKAKRSSEWPMAPWILAAMLCGVSIW